LFEVESCFEKTQRKKKTGPNRTNSKRGGQSRAEGDAIIWGYKRKDHCLIGSGKRRGISIRPSAWRRKKGENKDWPF